MDQKLLDKAMEASTAKTIKELFAEDPARAEKFTVSAAGWTLDYSKNRIDEKVMKALVKLAKESNLKEEIEKMREECAERRSYMDNLYEMQRRINL